MTGPDSVRGRLHLQSLNISEWSSKKLSPGSSQEQRLALPLLAVSKKAA
ncbi:hypothetical protein OSCI_3460085 [Kamptonema sp. PCC 6506]|nr:hypothetical protein OSCI_3460085 [Kamptonema sp. PCC 6506]